ncbi:hypothetical protein Tco_0262005 [Tanacetum coccineum]
MERLIIKGKVTLMEDEGKPLAKVDSLDDHDSEDKVASVDNDMANSLASIRVSMALIVYWNNGRKLMRMMTMILTHTMMICMKPGYS